MKTVNVYLGRKIKPTSTVSNYYQSVITIKQYIKITRLIVSYLVMHQPWFVIALFVRAYVVCVQPVALTLLLADNPLCFDSRLIFCGN